MRLVLLLALLTAQLVVLVTPQQPSRSFVIENNRFVKDGKPIRLFSGRLLRLKSMGLNAIQFLVPWAWHEPRSGEYTFEGWSDLPRYLEIANDLNMLVMLRPGPYICGEWDFGGLPAWLPTSRMAGGTTMQIRSDDPAFLFQVAKWWRVLFARVRPYLYQHGGPIVMVQLENEYGYCEPAYGIERARRYMRALRALARQGLGEDVVLYTTDPPYLLHEGSLPGDEVYSVVDFGVNYGHPEGPFTNQSANNPPGKSPYYNSEFYTGWLTHWGESSSVANMSMDHLGSFLNEMLEYGNRTASFNLYMAHGGTNFGFHAGANTAGAQYQPHITSYDYDSPISEAGDYGQPGAYGTVQLTASAVLLDNLDVLAPGSGLVVSAPEVMEEYGQRWGFVLYRASLPASNGWALDLQSPVHDYAHVLVNGHVVAMLDRSSGQTSLHLPAVGVGGSRAGVVNGAVNGAVNITQGGAGAVLDILVQAMGHENFGCGYWDRKGLTSSNVTVNGAALQEWRVFNMEFKSLDGIAWQTAPANNTAEEGPRFYRGTFEIAADTKARHGSNGGHLPDTYLSTPGWIKGVAWVNGFNLGWYWPQAGPQLTLYVPGPVLREGSNELVLLEVGATPAQLQGMQTQRDAEDCPSRMQHSATG